LQGSAVQWLRQVARRVAELLIVVLISPAMASKEVSAFTVEGQFPLNVTSSETRQRQGVICALTLAFAGVRDEPPDDAVGASLIREQALSRPTRARADSDCSTQGSVALAQFR
jgi:hypothetical protein